MIDRGYALIAAFVTLIAAFIGYFDYRVIKLNAAFDWPASGFFAVSFCAFFAIATLAVAIFLWHQAWEVQRQ